MKTRSALVIYARPPLRGRVKTRLQPDLSPDEALAIYEAMLADVVERSASAMAGRGACFLAWSEPCDPPGLLAGLMDAVTTEIQSGDDLGQRMAHTLQEKLHRGFGRVVLLGADSPHLPPVYLKQAFESLDTADLVIGPADDGGYYLLGARRLHPRIFQNMPWGTEKVIEITRRRIKDGAISSHELPRWYDIDTPADVARLWGDLRRMSAKRAPDLPRRTYEILAALAPGRL